MTEEQKIVNVTMFGAFSVEYRGKRIVERSAPVENQSWQLLRYLVINVERSVTMDELMRELSFSGRVEDAFNTIRVRLRRSRQLLDEIGLGTPRDGLILYGNDKFWINPAYQLETDQQKIDLHYVSLIDGKRSGTDELNACVDTLTCFGGRFLETAKSSAWVDRMREHYDSVYRQLLERCIALMAETGDYSHAADVWENALKMVPQEIPIHEALLRGLLQTGHVAQAVTYYSRLAVVLANTETALPPFGSLMQ